MVAFIKKWRKKAILMYGKARGLSKKQRTKVTKAAHGKTYKPRPTQKKVTERGKEKMTRRSGFGVRSLFKWLRLGSLAYPGINTYVHTRGTPMQRASKAVGAYAGFWDGKFRWDVLANCWVPYIAVSIVTHGVGKLMGIIRRL